MATYQAAGAGPIAFFNTLNNQYNQVEIPLSAIYFTGNGIDATSWPLYSTYKAQVSGVLALLASQGYLSASAAGAVAAPGLTATATLSGAAGNGIAIQIASPSLSSGTANITVTKTEVYPDLAPAGLAAALGNSAASSVGLVYDAGAGTGEMPVAFSGAIGAGMNVAVPEAADGTKTSFTLAATMGTDAADAELIQVNVAPASGATPATFTLTVSWTKSASGASLAGLTTAATNPFIYLLIFAGQMGPMPSSSTVTLSGGAPAEGSTPAVSASVSLLAGS